MSLTSNWVDKTDLECFLLLAKAMKSVKIFFFDLQLMRYRPPNHQADACPFTSLRSERNSAPCEKIQKTLNNSITTGVSKLYFKKKKGPDQDTLKYQSHQNIILERRYSEFHFSRLNAAEVVDDPHKFVLLFQTHDINHFS